MKLIFKNIYPIYFLLLLLFSVSCSTDEGVYVPIHERIGALPVFVIDPVDNPTTSEQVVIVS